MRDYKDITQRIIDKGDRILAEKQQKKRRIVNITLKAGLFCGCICLCVGTAAVWKLFISPDTDDGERYPIVTTQITAMSQVTGTTAVTTTVTTEKKDTEHTTALTERPQDDIEITTAAPISAEEKTTQTAVVTEVTVRHTTAVNVPTAVTAEPQTSVSYPPHKETTSTTAVHYVRDPVEVFPEITVDGNEYYYNGVDLTAEQAGSLYIMWRRDAELVDTAPDGGEEQSESVEILGVNEETGKQEFVIVYFRKWERYVLYRSK